MRWKGRESINEVTCQGQLWARAGRTVMSVQDAGCVIFALGLLGILVSSKGQRGWENWGTAARWGASVSLVVVVTGLVLMDRPVP